MADRDQSGQEQQVRSRVYDRLEAGSLPPDTGQRTFGSRGDGSLCACCDQPIKAEDLQYDMDVRDDSSSSPTSTLSMHLRCYRMWVEESGIRRIRMLEPE
jgi:hypothetical protein